MRIAPPLTGQRVTVDDADLLAFLRTKTDIPEGFVVNAVWDEVGEVAVDVGPESAVYENSGRWLVEYRSRRHTVTAVFDSEEVARAAYPVETPDMIGVATTWVDDETGEERQTIHVAVSVKG